MTNRLFQFCDFCDSINFIQNIFKEHVHANRSNSTSKAKVNNSLMYSLFNRKNFKLERQSKVLFMTWCFSFLKIIAT